MASPKRSKIPSISVLYEELGFQHASAEDKTLFTDACHAWRKFYITSTKCSESKLLLWKESRTQLHLDTMAKGFVEESNNGQVFWGAGKSWASGLVFPTHKAEITVLLKQLFWNQNRYFWQNSIYNARRKSRERNESGHIDSSTLPRMLKSSTGNTSANRENPANNSSREKNGSYHKQPLSKKRRNLNHASVAELGGHIIDEDPTSGPRQGNHRTTVPGIIESDRMIVPSKFTAPIARMGAISRVDNQGYLLSFPQTPRRPLKHKLATKSTKIQNTSQHPSFPVCTDISGDTGEDIREQIIPTANPNSTETTIPKTPETQVQTSLWVFTFQPRRTLERWDEETVQWMHFPAFIQNLTQRIGTSDFEEVMFTLEAPSLTVKSKISKNAEALWQSTRETFEETAKKEVTKAKSLGKTVVAFKIFIDPVYDQVALHALHNVINEDEMDDIILDF